MRLEASGLIKVCLNITCYNIGCGCLAQGNKSWLHAFKTIESVCDRRLHCMMLSFQQLTCELIASHYAGGRNPAHMSLLLTLQLHHQSFLMLNLPDGPCCNLSLGGALMSSLVTLTCSQQFQDAAVSACKPLVLT